jgi:hypothetical protein
MADVNGIIFCVPTGPTQAIAELQVEQLKGSCIEQRARPDLNWAVPSSQPFFNGSVVRIGHSYLFDAGVDEKEAAVPAIVAMIDPHLRFEFLLLSPSDLGRDLTRP